MLYLCYDDPGAAGGDPMRGALLLTAAEGLGGAEGGGAAWS